MIAPIPTNEDARLRALRDCRVLDTPAEDDFDDITRRPTSPTASGPEKP